VLTGGTDVHLVLCDLRESELDGKQAEDRLHSIGITVNRNAVPFDPRPPAVSSGLRIGSPALATRGLQVEDFIEVGKVIATTLNPGGPFEERQQELRERVTAFMEEVVYPNESVFHRQVAEGPSRWEPTPVMEEMKREARRRELWNLFLPESDYGAGLTNLEYAPLAEVMGRSPIGSEPFNCAAPDTGNMEVLVRYGTPEQQRAWLVPLNTRVCFLVSNEPGSRDSKPMGSQVEPTEPKTPPPSGEGVLQRVAPSVRQRWSSWRTCRVDSVRRWRPTKPTTRAASSRRCALRASLHL